jgi:hypothetical protein
VKRSEGCILVLAGCLLTAGIGCSGPGNGGDLGFDVGPGQYTILLETASMPGHLAWIKQYKQVVMRHTGWSDAELMAMQIDEDHSALYLDTYDNFGDARSRLSEIRQITTAKGTQPFRRAIIVPVPGQDIGPDKWNLAHVDRGMYTLLVGKWQNSPGDDFYRRKEWAVRHCKRLRDKGHPAYFYHGQSESLVTVGIFDYRAVEMVEQDGKKRPVIVDPRVEKLRRSNEQFQYMLVNGHVAYERIAQIDPNTRQGVFTLVEDPDSGEPVAELPKKPYLSHLVHLPQRDRTKEDKARDQEFHDLSVGFPRPW